MLFIYYYFFFPSISRCFDFGAHKLGVTTIIIRSNLYSVEPGVQSFYGAPGLTGYMYDSIVVQRQVVCLGHGRFECDHGWLNFFFLFWELLSYTGDKSDIKLFSGRQLHETSCKPNDHICVYITLSLAKVFLCVDRLNVKQEGKHTVRI